MLVLSHPSITGPTDVLTTVAAGGVGAVLALLALTVDETDEAFANIYSTAVSLQNAFPRASQRSLIVGVATLATAISLGVNLTQYQQFLLLLGAFFVPLFGVLLADWLIAGRHYTRDHIFAGPAWRPGMIAAWLVGFVLYEWIAQTQGLGFWSHWLARAPPGERRDRRFAAELRDVVRAGERNRRARAGSTAPARPRIDLAGLAPARSHRTSLPRHRGRCRAADRRRAVVRRPRAAHARAGGVLFAKCGEDDRARFQRRLATLGLPATLAVGGETTSFSFTYDADGTRTMRVETIGEPWQTDEPQGTLLQRVEWLHVAPLLRSDFDAAALERLGLGRRLMLDAQGLVRVPAVGPLQLDANYDPELLAPRRDPQGGGGGSTRARRRAEPESLAELGVPEIVLTLGEAGSTVIVRGHAEHVPARPADGGSRSDGCRRRVRRRVSRRTRRRPRTGIRRPPCDSARRRVADEPMIAAVDTAEGVLLFDVAEELPLGPGNELPSVDRAARRAAARRRDRRRRRDDRRASSTGARRSRSRTTAARRGARPAVDCPPVSRSRSPRTIPTGCSTPAATASTSRSTAASSGARCRSSCRTSRGRLDRLKRTRASPHVERRRQITSRWAHAARKAFIASSPERARCVRSANGEIE